MAEGNLKYAFFLLLMMFSSCFIFRKTENNRTTLTKDVVVDSVLRHTVDYKTLNYKFLLKYKDSQKKYDIFGTYTSFKDSLLYIDLSMAFGLRVAEMWLTPDSAFLYMPFTKSFYKGKNDAFLKKYNIAFDFYSVQNFLSYNLFPYPYFYDLKNYEFSFDKFFYILENEIKNKRNPNLTDVKHQIFIDSQYKIDSVSIVDYVLNKEIYYKYNDLKKYDNERFFPTEVEMTIISNDTLYLDFRLKNITFDEGNSIPKIDSKNAKVYNF